MRHSVWAERINNDHKQIDLYFERSLITLLIIFFFWGLFFVLPDLASAYNSEKTGSISRSGESVAISAVYAENEKNISHNKGNKALIVKGTPKDKEIKQKIMEEIDNDPFIETKNIVVIIENGVVILKGTVNNVTEHAAATADALQAGAKEVRNYLKVRESPALTHNENEDESS